MGNDIFLYIIDVSENKTVVLYTAKRKLKIFLEKNSKLKLKFTTNPLKSNFNCLLYLSEFEVTLVISFFLYRILSF